MSKNKAILVTGGAGYIGSHVCKSLSKAGFDPITYDNLSTGHKHAVKWGDFEEGDILDTENLQRVINKHEIEAVVHMAAFIAVGESVQFPGKYYKNNTMGGLSVIEAMKNCSIDKIVFSSTAAVYGIPEQMPIVEESPIKPINPYGFSKFVVEQMLRDFKVSDNIKSVTLRYFNVAGADPETKIGCEHKNPNNLIPVIMNVLSGKQDYLEVFGTDYDTHDGTAIRDYIHVTDLADAHVLSLNHLFDEGENLTLNLGTGRGHSVKEVVDSVNKVTGKKVATKNALRRAGDPPILYANAQKAQEIIKFKTTYSDLDAITKSAWDWQQKISH